MSRTKNINPIRILLDPRKYVLISAITLAIVGYIIFNEIDFDALNNLDFGQNFFFFLALAAFCVVIRVGAYVYRIHVLTDKQFKIKHLIQVIVMWEFTSAITPSAVGGAPVAIYYLSKEGLSAGKSTSIVMLTALMDQLFFIIMTTICYFTVSEMFPDNIELAYLSEGIKVIFFTSFYLIIFYASIISYGILVKPNGLKNMLLFVFKLPLLRKFQSNILKVTDDILMASQELKQRPLSYWLKGLIATFIAWSSRFILVNFLILSIAGLSEHFLVYARQLVMWVVMLISPTPGSSGVAELAFNVYLKEFIPQGVSGAMALLWRILSYYVYIIVGFIVLPRWLKRIFVKRKLIKFKSI